MKLPRKTFELYRDCFGSCGFEICKSKLIEVEKLEYLDSNNAVQLVPAVTYYINESNEYSTLLLDAGQSWPTDLSQRTHRVICTFTAGYDDQCKIPEDLRMAILAHATKLYENRGDCDCSNAADMAKFVPAQSSLVYAQYRILLADFL